MITEREDRVESTRSIKTPYDEFANRYSDLEPPTEQYIPLAGWKIARSKMTPEAVCKLLESNHRVTLWRSLRAEFPLLFLFVLSVVLYFFLPSSWTLFEPVPLYIFVPLFLLGALLHRLLNYKYSITKDYVSATKGIFGLMVKVVQVEYDQMKAVEVTKTLYQRLVDVGNIRISVPLFDQPEIVMRGVHNPYFYRTVLHLAIKRQNEKEASHQISDTPERLEPGEPPSALEGPPAMHRE